MHFKKVFIFMLCVLALMGCSNQHKKVHANIILDTDFGPFYDDIGAITVLHALAQEGNANILATIADNRYQGVAAMLDVFNTFWGEPNIPIGVPKGAAVDNPDTLFHWTDTLMEKYPHKITSNEEVPGAVEVYRKVLSHQPDTSVTILSIGFLTNLANLLKSKGDNYSPLDGLQLIKKKVRLLVCMAGVFPSGKEFNMKGDSTASQYALENWPTRIIFSGSEIGEKIKAGLPLINDDKIHHDPAKDVYRICSRIGASDHLFDSIAMMSWDPVTALVAVEGYQPYFTLHAGRIIVNADGSNTWDNNGKGQFYLVQKESPSKVSDVINRLLMQLPDGKSE